MRVHDRRSGAKYIFAGRNRLDSGTTRHPSPWHAGSRPASTMPKRHGAAWLILALMLSVLASAGCRDHAISSTTRSTSFDPTGMDSVEILNSLKRGSVTSAELVAIYADRIAKFDKAGPELNSIIAMNPHARALADVLDRERAAGKVRGRLHGLPIIVKDSYDIVGMPTTGGSVALANAYPSRNAAVVQRMVDAGAIVLAKANMSELAISGGKYGYSSVLGVTLNPYNLKRSSSGSSSGTASAIAANFAALGLGTDSIGSVVNPSSVNGLVGIRPTLGLTSRTGVLPFALPLDVTGPMAPSVKDVALALTIMAGTDVSDPATAEADARKHDYFGALNSHVLAGARIGVAFDFFGGNAEVDAAVKRAVNRMRELGTNVVQVPLPAWMSQLGGSVLKPLHDLEFKRDFETYLATFPPGSPKTVADVIAISDSKGVRESAHPANPKLIEGLLKADAVSTAPDAASNRERILRVEMPRVREALMDTFARLKLDALVFPTMKCTASPVFTSEDNTYSCDADKPANGGLVAPAAGFPEVTVPVGHDSQRLPIGMSFLGPRYGEQRILDLAASLEQASPTKDVPAAVS
jgi:amidase